MAEPRIDEFIEDFLNPYIEELVEDYKSGETVASDLRLGKMIGRLESADKIREKLKELPNDTD